MRGASAVAACAATVVIAAAIAVGCGDDGDDAGGSVVSPAALAMLAPSEAVVYADFTVRPTGETRDGLRALIERFGGDGDDIDEVAASLFEEEDGFGDASLEDELAYEDDVEPWLGDRAALFALELRRAGEDDFDGTVAAILPTTDASEAEAKAEELIGGSERKRGGVPYRTGEEIAWTMLGDFLVAGDEAAVRAAVDAWNGDADASLASEVSDSTETVVNLVADAGFVFRTQLTSPPDPLTEAEADALLAELSLDSSIPTTLSASVSEDGDAEVLQEYGVRSSAPLTDAAAALEGLPEEAVLGIADPILFDLYVESFVAGIRVGLEEEARLAGISPRELAARIRSTLGADLLGLFEGFEAGAISVLRTDDEPVAAATLTTPQGERGAFALARFLFEFSLGGRIEEGPELEGGIPTRTATTPDTGETAFVVAAPAGEIVLAAGEDEERAIDAIEALAGGEGRDLSQFADQLEPGYELTGFGDLGELGSLLDRITPEDEVVEAVAAGLADASLIAGAKVEGDRYSSLMRLDLED